MNRNCAVLVAILVATCVYGQGLRYSNYREIAPPEYATLRIGPFFSSVTFSQSAAYRYSKGKGAGVDFLVANERGEIKEDGEEYPLISSLAFRNYLIVTRKMDLDLSAGMRYEHYPLETQEDAFTVALAEEGIYGNLTSEFILTPVIKGRMYDGAVYRTDYVDTRGLDDRFGGSQHEYFRNNIGIDLDWLMMKERNVGLSVNRTDMMPRDDEFEDQEYVAHSASIGYQHRFFEGLSCGIRGGWRDTEYESTNRTDTSQLDYGLSLNFGYGRGVETGVPLTRATTLIVAVGGSTGYTRGEKGVRSSDGTNGTAVTESESDRAMIGGRIGLETMLKRNLKQKLEFSRGMRSGWEWAFEIYDQYEYRLHWQGTFASWELYSRLGVVEPTRKDVTDYRNWVSGIDISCPITRFITLLIASTYTVRTNEGEVVNDDVEVEWQNDYETWNSRVGTSFGITEWLDFTTYYQHIERISDSDDLAYERDVFEARLSFTHEF